MSSLRAAFRVVVLAIGVSAAAARALAQAPEPQPVRPVGAAEPTLSGAVQRWFDVQMASFMARYRRVGSSAGEVMSNHLQDSIGLKFRLKLDAKGRYSLNAGVATGSSFIGGWNNLGVGTGGDRVLTMYLKQLFVDAAPVDGLDLSYGALAIVRGESTEITSYDNDGYVTGERVSIKRPSLLYLDDITFTNAYLGDANAPGFSDRYGRLDERNYRHLLAGKKFGRSLGVSADYTRLSGVSTLRAAFNVKTPHARIVDIVRYEQYRRFGADRALGFAAYGEKAVWPRVTAGLGYADVDPDYGGLNADRFNRGRRLFEQGAVKIARDLSASVFVTQAIHNDVALSNRRRVDVVVSYNAMGPLQRAGLFR